MAKQSYDRRYTGTFFTFAGNITREIGADIQVVSTSTVSPRVNGKLQLRENPFSFNRRIVNHCVTGYNDQDRNAVSVFSMLPYVTAPQHYPDATNIAFSNLASKVANVELNLAVAFAEARATHDLVASNISSIVKAMLALSRGNVTKAARILKIEPPARPKSKHTPLSERWLELQYGWLPLMADIKAACEYSPPISREVSASASFTGPVMVNVINASSYLRHEIKSQATTKCRIKCRVVLRSTPVATASELGLLDPLTVVWELVPFSFVADWFIPIGQYLGNLRAFDGKGVVNPTWTRITEKSYDCTAIINPNVPPNSVYNKSVPGGIASRIRYYGQGGGSSSSGIQFDRVVGLPPNSYLVPKFKSPFSLNHFANAFALLRVLTK